LFTGLLLAKFSNALQKPNRDRFKVLLQDRFFAFKIIKQMTCGHICTLGHIGESGFHIALGQDAIVQRFKYPASTLITPARALLEGKFLFSSR
jgi:hypothetical protein